MDESRKSRVERQGRKSKRECRWSRGRSRRSAGGRIEVENERERLGLVEWIHENNERREVGGNASLEVVVVVRDGMKIVYIGSERDWPVAVSTYAATWRARTQDLLNTSTNYFTIDCDAMRKRNMKGKKRKRKTRG